MFGSVGGDRLLERLGCRHRFVTTFVHDETDPTQLATSSPSATAAPISISPQPFERGPAVMRNSTFPFTPNQFEDWR